MALGATRRPSLPSRKVDRKKPRRRASRALPMARRSGVMGGDSEFGRWGGGGGPRDTQTRLNRPLLCIGRQQAPFKRHGPVAGHAPTGPSKADPAGGRMKVRPAADDSKRSTAESLADSDPAAVLYDGTVPKGTWDASTAESAALSQPSTGPQWQGVRAGTHRQRPRHRRRPLRAPKRPPLVQVERFKP